MILMKVMIIMRLIIKDEEKNLLLREKFRLINLFQKEL